MSSDKKKNQTTKRCSVDGCTRKYHQAGFCGSHYIRNWKYGDPLAGGPHKRDGGGPCEILGCDQTAYANGLCNRHYHREYKRRIAAEAPERIREHKLQSRYGLSLDAYSEMEAKQDGRCAICSEKTKLVVDHDHETGRIRGLLCNKCNSGIGLLGDDVDGLINALRYLSRG